MAIPTDKLEQMLKEIVAGVPGPPDESDEEKKTRQLMTDQVEEIKSKGGIVRIPPEVAG